MCALLSLTATSHCLQEKKKTSKAAGKQKEEGKGAGSSTEAVNKKLSKAEAKMAEAKVVPQPLDGDGNPIDTEKCTVTIIEEEPARQRKRSKRMTSSYSARILHVRYRILCRILNTRLTLVRVDNPFSDPDILDSPAH